MLRSLEDREDREMLILAVAYLELGLERLMLEPLEGLHDEEAASRFFNGAGRGGLGVTVKINLAEALGKISAREARELRYIRDLRNEFAHGWDQLVLGVGDVKVKAQRLPAWEGGDLVEAVVGTRPTTTVPGLGDSGGVDHEGREIGRPNYRVYDYSGQLGFWLPARPDRAEPLSDRELVLHSVWELAMLMLWRSAGAWTEDAMRLNPWEHIEHRRRRAKSQ
jgi:hypothetical protein